MADEEAAPPPVEEEPHRVDTILRKWWDDHMPGSELARVTEAWNHVYGALAELARRLKED